MEARNESERYEIGQKNEDYTEDDEASQVDSSSRFFCLKFLTLGKSRKEREKISRVRKCPELINRAGIF